MSGHEKCSVREFCQCFRTISLVMLMFLFRILDSSPGLISTLLTIRLSIIGLFTMWFVEMSAGENVSIPKVPPKYMLPDVSAACA